MEQFQLRLNPKKCAFCITSGKLLGYIISNKSIEVNLEKLQEIMEMLPPRNINQLKSLQGCLQSIRRFISQLVDKAQSFNKNFHKGSTHIWNDDCQQSLDQIKGYLEKPLVLMPPILRKLLILYISAKASSLGALLAQNDETSKEWAIYYISQTLVAYEMNYTSIKKACLAVVFASQKLQHYMLAHTVHLIAKIDSLKYLLRKVVLTGHLAKWMMILIEFDIQYVEGKAIKGQARAD